METVSPSSPSNSRIVLYTDGACSGNPGPGGWGVVLEYGTSKKTLYGGEMETTNNRMELKAAIEGLKALKRKCIVDLYTDSQYVKEGINVWIHQWKQRGWKTASKKPVKNVDLWQLLDDLVATHEVHWHWVRGHNGNPGNELADQLAVQGCKEMQRRL